MGRVGRFSPWPICLVFLSVLLSATTGCGSKPNPEGSVAGPPPRFSDRMDGIARRLERLGRAAEVGRWDLARYEVEELKETFEDVERTPLPEDVGQLNLREFIDPLVEEALPALDAALARQDRTEVRITFAGVAQRCNNCHRAAGRGFVEIPDRPGAEIPALTRPSR
jgi:hypothetical protein